MSLILDAVEVRVLGSLLEKEITTPEYYPLSLNALVNACNQKTNREPVVVFDEHAVNEALELLRHKGLAFVQTGAGSRVPKHGHRINEKLNLGRRELALLCSLMLRGPQTIGELRGVSERMHRFADLEEVETCLRGLMEREAAPLVTNLGRLPGRKEPRYAHLLSGEPAIEAGEVEHTPLGREEDRIAALELEGAELRARVATLERDVDKLMELLR